MGFRKNDVLSDMADAVEARRFEDPDCDLEQVVEVVLAEHDFTEPAAIRCMGQALRSLLESRRQRRASEEESYTLYLRRNMARIDANHGARDWLQHLEDKKDRLSET